VNRVWVLDVDKTLYSAQSGLFACIVGKIEQYMIGRLGIPAGQVRALIQRYRDRYGLTMGGLVAHHGVDPDEYLAFIHDVSREEFLSPDPILAEALQRLSGRKVVFTNGSEVHARSVLDCLGIDGQVDEVYDLRFMDYTPKPKPHGYHKLLEALGAEGTDCWMVDDRVDNLDTARAFGMTTVLVGPTAAPPHLHVTSPRELPRLAGGVPPASPARRRT
jgi:putative hydrolase of the HAD superfamily